MALPAATRRMTAAEYLDAEHAALDRHEFHDGERLAMAGSTFEHDQITGNALVALKNGVDGTDCRVLTSNLCVRPAVSSRYVYPDLSVVCGPPQFDPPNRRRTKTIGTPQSARSRRATVRACPSSLWRPATSHHRSTGEFDRGH